MGPPPFDSSGSLDDENLRTKRPKRAEAENGVDAILPICGAGDGWTLDELLVGSYRSS